MRIRISDVKRREIQLIHIAKQQLGMDDDSYRGILWTVCRVKSSTELDFVGRKKLLDHMKSCGFKVASNKNAGKPSNVKADLKPLMGKIGALLADMKLTWKYASAIAKQQTLASGGIERLEWLNAEQLRDVVSALMKKQAKAAK
jgi:phage gp16-like protein